MSFTLGASHAPASSSRGLISAALATGAAMMAGALLGRRSLPGIAAGLAALAGAKWLSSTRRPAPLLRLEYGTPTIDVSPEVYPPEIKKGQDWIDHDAVDYCHHVPDPITARELLKEKVLPLLDDDGSPVHEFVDVAAQAVSTETSAHDVAPEPLIWEPTNGAQSRSEGACETVWFGLQEPIVIGRHEQPCAVPPLQPTPEAPQLPHEGKMAASAVLPDTIIPPPGFLPKKRGAPFSVPLKTATFPLQKVVLPGVPASIEHDLPSPSPAESAVSSPGAASHSTPLPFFTSAAVAGASVISPKSNTNSSLPTPRRQGELPKHVAGEPAAPSLPSIADALPKDTRAWLRKFPTLPETAPTAAAMPARRHLEPLAPMCALPSSPRRWPLLVLLTLLLSAFLFLAVDGWKHGDLLRKIKGMALFQKEAVIKDVMPSPAAGGKVSAMNATKPASWVPATLRQGARPKSGSASSAH